MENFTEIKEEIINRAKTANACKEWLKVGLDAENIEDLMFILKNNFKYCINKKIVDCKLLELIGQKICNENDVYFNVSTDKGFLLVDSATVSASGYTLVVACGSASVIASGFATVIACSGTSVSAYGDTTVSACSSANVDIYENSRLSRWE